MTLSRRQVLTAATAPATGAALRSRTAFGDSMPDLHTFELRQYTLRSGQREALISLFERHFVGPQNELGAQVVASFRDLDDPDRLVWIRGFVDMAARPRALEAFYDGPVWRPHRDEANATMLDSDNVLLLRPASQGAGFAALATPTDSVVGVVGASIHYLGKVDAEQFAAFFRRAVLPHLKALGVEPLATLISQESPNNFPRLPVRQHEPVFTWFARWPNLESHDSWRARFRQVSGWRDAAPEGILPALMRKPEELRLIPTDRSALR